MNTNELEGDALNRAVALALGYKLKTPAQVCGYDRWVRPDGCELCYSFEPSTHWAEGGPLITSHNIMLSPPTSRVHRNGGNSPGWGQSGLWGATTFHAGEHGRAFGHHETEPLIAAMRCLVMFYCGKEVSL